uniref:Uncharacterized protein n=1 Tax=Anguilla anguilla TaxID=7936 RepID=A0A0E9XET6_ANGAN
MVKARSQFMSYENRDCSRTRVQVFNPVFHSDVSLIKEYQVDLKYHTVERKNRQTITVLKSAKKR